VTGRVGVEGAAQYGVHYAELICKGRKRCCMRKILETRKLRLCLGRDGNNAAHCGRRKKEI
jgi:hypothetical protein